MTKKIFNTETLDIVRTEGYSNKNYSFMDHKKEMPKLEASIAIELVNKWGMVAGKPDGEDSSGRAKLALLSPAEVVDRAVQTSEMLVNEFRRLGWLDKMPSAEELYEE